MKGPANYHPDFNITRASHVVLGARDLDQTEQFYSGFLGFLKSYRDKDILCLRGLEERAHHSLVFRRAEKSQVCHRVGLRVLEDDDLRKAFDYFASKGRPCAWVEAPHQGLTLHVDDAVGTPIELCASMAVADNALQRFELYKSASPMRLDHFQIVTHDVKAAMDFYLDLGFRLTEYTSNDGGDEIWGAWLQRKGNTQDLVFSSGKGPRIHHFAYTVPEIRDIIHVCDVASSLGYASRIERGPGRHGIGNAFFVYFRDPDGHRIELFNAHYQAIDTDVEPLRWDLSNTRRSQLWGLPATSKWFYEATEFENKSLIEPKLTASPVTLETFLAGQF